VDFIYPAAQLSQIVPEEQVAHFKLHLTQETPEIKNPSLHPVQTPFLQLLHEDGQVTHFPPDIQKLSKH
jgi:hypothetical protein